MIGVVLHFSAHPDDELIGPPATLMALRDAGHRIVDVPCGLGRREQHARRTAELQEAHQRAGFELLVPDRPPIVSSRDDDVRAVSAAVLDLARAMIDDLDPEIVVTSTPHDRHPSHELVARAVRDALSELGENAPAWWMWGLWGALAMPTLGTAFDQPRLEEILTALSAYRGELDRNDYRDFVQAKARLSASQGPELLFGLGTRANAPAPYVELLTEAIPKDGCWLLGAARWLDATVARVPPSDTDIGPWLYAESLTDKLGPPGMQRVAQPQQ